MTRSQDLKDWIRSLGHELGFDLIGFTTADVSDRDAEALDRWLDAGQHGSMGYMANKRDMRRDLQSLLPGARSVIATSTRYQAAPHGAAPIASYATRDDYHHVLKRRLKVLAEHLRERFPEDAFRPAVDTAPLLERSIAARAGLGWIGKSTNLIHESLGCHTLLGEILTTIEIEPDSPSKDRCGTCQRCLDACPTSAFEAPFRLDARKCLSYWTIEHRGSIPSEIHEKLGPRLFGCDDCLTSCPFGHRDREAPSPSLPSTPDLTSSPLRTLVEEGRDRFKRTFSRTPVPRALKKGFLRNAAIALFHAEGESSRSTQEDFLLHDDPAVRLAAVRSLSRLGPAPSRAALERCLVAEADDSVRKELALCLQSSSPPNDSPQD